MTSSADDKRYNLICPLDYSAAGQSWYLESTNSKAGKSSDLNMTANFSVCVICSYPNKTVEICIGHETMNRTKMAHKGCQKSDECPDVPIVWSGTPNPVGLSISMSKENLLSTLQTIEAINDLSQVSLFLNCPNGFQLDGFEGRITTGIQKQTPCIVCSGGGLSFSTCYLHGNSKPDYSGILPIFGPTCPWNTKQTPDGCRQSITELITTNQTACGTYLSAHNLIWRITDIKAEYIRLDCATLPEKSGNIEIIG